MRRIFIIGVMLVFAVQAQEIPVEVQRIVNSYKKDSIGVYGFKNAQKHLGLDKSINASDITVGVPFQECLIVRDSLEKMADSVPIELIIKPIYWRIPIIANGKYVYMVKVSKKGNSWEAVGMGGFNNEHWQKLRERWPESSGVNPVVITFGKRHFYYFPNLHKSNLFYLRPKIKNDSLALITSNSLDKFDESRKIFHFLKKEIKQKEDMEQNLNRKNPLGEGSIW